MLTLRSAKRSRKVLEEFEKIQEKLKQLGVELYKASSLEDRLIAVWWDSLCESNELQQLFASNAHSLSGLFSVLRQPNMALYTTWHENIESIHWAEPVNTSANAVFFSSWCHPTLRGKKRQGQILHSIYSLLFAMGKKLILGITKQEKLLSLHQGMGYDILGPIPHLFDDAHAWLVYMTKPTFLSSRLSAVVNKLEERENDTGRVSRNSRGIRAVS